MNNTAHFTTRTPFKKPTVLVTRARDQAGPLADRIKKLGARVLVSPAIQTEHLPLDSRGRRHLKNLEHFDAVVFTSARAVEHVARMRSLFHKGTPPPWPARTALHAVGPQTAAAIRAQGWPAAVTVVLCGGAQALADRLADRARDTSFLFPRARDGRDALARRLTQAGGRVTLWPVYATGPVPPTPAARRALRAGRVNAVLYTSPSTVNSLWACFSAGERRTIHRRTRAVSIGPTTTKALTSLGVTPVEADQHTIPSLIRALKEVLSF